ncbi:MAG: hypothetical protein V2A65_08080 [Candidatus Omnitrophota bacterium]
MRLDLTKLEKVRRRGSNTIARCPACAESGGDRKGEHLFINDRGQFGCVLYPGVDGQTHRQRIFELAGTKEMPGNGFEVRRPLSSSTPGPTVIQKDILGHLGHIESTHARKSLNIPVKKIEDDIQEDLNKSVPTVPEPETKSQNKVIFTSEEERLLAGIDTKSLEQVRRIKKIFSGTVVAVEDTACGTGANR